MLIPEVLQKPLVFGDVAQIQALRAMAEAQEYDALPDCDECKGTGEVPVDCTACHGEGKEPAAFEVHLKKYGI